MSNTERVLPQDTEMPMDERLVSIHSINPFIGHCSSSRSYMFSAHLSQCLTPEGAEEKIIQTGAEKELASNTFHITTGNRRVKVLKAISRYRDNGSTINNSTVEIMYIVKDLDTGVVDCISVKEFFNLMGNYGFKYSINKEQISKIQHGTILEPNTILADSPAVKDGKGYGFGVNANVCLMSTPETAEDGIIISDRLASKLRHRIYEERTIEFGEEYFPLNIYGDKDNYKPFPNIGETIRPDGLLCALRKHDDKLAPSLTSVNDVKDVNPIFDKCFYVKASKGTVLVHNDMEYASVKEVQSCRVVDIRVHTNAKYKKTKYTKVADLANDYATANMVFYRDILQVYEELKEEQYTLEGNRDVKLSNTLHRLIIDAMAIAGNPKQRIAYTFKSDPIDMYRVTIVVEYLVLPTIGSKISNLHGAKGVVVKVLPLIDMPYDPNTNEYADIIQDSTSINSRMNVSWLYEMYFGAMSRRTKRLIRETLGLIPTILPNNSIMDNNFSIFTKEELKAKGNLVDKAYNILLGLLEIIGTDQITVYKEATLDQKLEILLECINKEVFIVYRLNSKKTAYQVVRDSKGTIYEPTNCPIYISKEELDGTTTRVLTKGPIRIAPSYTILLSKTADSFLAVSSSKTNHYGLPISVSSNIRTQLPWRNSPCRIISETEGRLYTSYVSRYAMAELKDRANSATTHKHLYYNILNSEYPTNIESVVDREKVPYGGDVILNLVQNIFNSSGIKIDYVPEPSI